MIARGYPKDFAERTFKQIEGFGSYGFPESHAASFAKIAYASCWMKHHHPDVFCSALLNAQPMGFYAPAQIVRDARNHGVEVRPVSINHSHWDCTLEPTRGRYMAVRLGFRYAVSPIFMVRRSSGRAARPPSPASKRSGAEREFHALQSNGLPKLTLLPASTKTGDRGYGRSRAWVKPPFPSLRQPMHVQVAFHRRGMKHRWRLSQ